MTALLKPARVYPSQTKYIVGNEACERFSYYGMRSILVVFMTSQLGMHSEKAQAVFHLFAGGVYLLPLAGAYLSDRFLGKYRTILFLSIIYCLGHLSLFLWESENGLYFGLTLIALGAGGIKPCVSAYVGDQFSEKSQDLLQRVFDIFYWSINFGSFFSTLLIPFCLVQFGSRVAFGIPGLLMALATLIFWLGRKQYVNVVPAREANTAGLIEILSFSIRNYGRKKPGQSFWSLAQTRYKPEEVEGVRSVLSLVRVFGTVSVFWALFDQNASSWVLQAQKMDLQVLGVHLQAAQLQALNPVMVMLLIPFFGAVIYPILRHLGFRVTPLQKMSAGMVLAGFSFLIVGFLQAFLDAGVRVSVAWQVLPYFILTCSEIMISVTGLEFAYTQAPKAMKSTVMSLWLLTVFIGNLLDAVVAELNIFQGALYFYFFAGLMFLVSLVFIISAAKYRVKNYLGTPASTWLTASH